MIRRRNLTLWKLNIFIFHHINSTFIDETLSTSFIFIPLQWTFSFNYLISFVAIASLSLIETLNFLIFVFLFAEIGFVLICELWVDERLRILLVRGRHDDIVLLHLFRMIILLTISTSCAQIWVNSSNNFINSIKSFIGINNGRSSCLNIQSTTDTRYAIAKCNLLLRRLILIINLLIDHALLLTSNTWAVIFAFFV